MNKRLSALVFGLIAIQLLIPTYGASEVEQPTAQQADAKYAPTNPTKAQVKAAAPTDLVYFPDPALAAALDMPLGMMGAPITVADMERLTMASIYGSNVTDLTGMEYAVNLTGFDVINCQITDLTPLSNLNELVTLTINQNQVTDITPIANLPKLKMFSANQNLIEDVSPFANNTVIENIMLPNNNISDISPLKNMTQLQIIQMAANHISDISVLGPLFDAGNLLFADFSIQNINGPDIIVTSGDEVSYNLTNYDGSINPLVLGTPAYGVNEFTDIAFDLPFEDIIAFNGIVAQKVTYVTLTGTETDSINESTTAMTDEELITLFNVVSIEDKVITVDQSAVNYDVPGTYDVIFDNGIDTVTSKLTVKDVKPTMSLTTDTVTIKLGATIDDYITTFGAVATEFTDGDLTNKIAVNDSAVNYNQAGKYEVILTVTDTEGNEVAQTGYVTIEDDTPVTPVDPDSEASEETNSEVSEETNSEVSEETNSEVSEETNSEASIDTNSEASIDTNSEASIDTNSEASIDTNTEKESTTTEDTKTNNSTEATKVMTESNQKSLASTGSLSTMLFILLSAVAMMVVSIKKSIVTKN